MQELFSQADVLLFKERKYAEAEAMFNQILKIEADATEMEKSDRNCIDAYNSIGYCVKFRTSLKDLIEDSPISSQPDGVGVFTLLQKIYNNALKLDHEDVEANFNLAGIYLQRKDLDSALRHYQACVRKDN